MSGEALAKQVGYKHQSAIGNLENRPGGTGGNKISEIAEVLQVPLEWLLRGPDGDTVPTVPQKTPWSKPSQQQYYTRESDQPGPYDQFIARDAMQLLNRLSDAGKRQAIVYLNFLLSQEATASQSVSREDNSLSDNKAA